MKSSLEALKSGELTDDEIKAHLATIRLKAMLSAKERAELKDIRAGRISSDAVKARDEEIAANAKGLEELNRKLTDDLPMITELAKTHPESKLEIGNLLLLGTHHQ